MAKKKLPPRQTPDRDSKYMGEAWMVAAFSKDRNTQVGAKIVTDDNEPLGSGYNGPPPQIPDDSFSWARPEPDDPPDQVNKNDLVIHAEINAMRRSQGYDLSNATLYVTAFPCKECMKEIVANGVGRIVYTDFRSNGGVLQDDTQRKKAEQIAALAGIKMEKFKGNIGWLADWVEVLKRKGVFDLK